MKRILFVDDEPHVLDGLRRMLHGQRHAWDMEFVSDGEAALAALAAAPFDVIVTDMRMPGLDGMALLRTVQERFPGLVRIVLSGHTEFEIALRAVPVAHVFLTKPCAADALVATIERACRLQALLEHEGLKHRVAGLGSLPSLPRAYAALTRALADPDVSLQKAARLVEQDMGLCAKLLHLVNSGFFGLPSRVTNVQTAIRQLGVTMLKNLALSVELFDHVAARAAGLSLANLQRHSMVTGGIARRLLGEGHQADDAFLAGILHDVGVLVLATRVPDQLAQDLRVARAGDRPLHEVERERAGVTHAEVGAYLLGLWGLPFPVVEAVANHHEPQRLESPAFDVAAAVHVANVLAHEHIRGTGTGHLLDGGYLERLGVAAQLPAWRAMAAEQAAFGGL